MVLVLSQQNKYGKSYLCSRELTSSEKEYKESN